MAEDIKIIFPDQGENATLCVHFEGGSARSLSGVICERKGWPATRGLRLIAGGRQLCNDDPVSGARTPVIHCIPLSATQQSSLAGVHQRSTVPCRDWLDVLNPTTTLQWFFGALLGLCWTAVIFYGDTFDPPTVIILCTMTAAFLAPYVLPFIPLPASLRPPCNPTAAAYPEGYTFIEGPDGGRIAVPPRPEAQIQAAYHAD
ncbi:g343 [Coccomyxa elongata]